MKKKSFRKIAKQVIELEIQSLNKLKKNINISFDKAVNAINNCKNGKVIISGVGKSWPMFCQKSHEFCPKRLYTST